MWLWDWSRLRTWISVPSFRGSAGGQGWVEAATGTSVFNPEIYYLTHLPARLNPAEVVQVMAMALGLSLLATLYPSWRAARTDPVEALRHE